MVARKWAEKLRSAGRGVSSREPAAESLRRRCVQRLQELDLPRTFDLSALCDFVADAQGRMLRLQPQQNLSTAAPCGLWVALPDTDYIFYEAGTSQLHADHIILHELCHMLCGHMDEGGVGRRISMSRLMPDLDIAMVLKVLGRVEYSTEQEREAELLASLIRVGMENDLMGARGGSLVDAVEEALNPGTGRAFR